LLVDEVLAVGDEQFKAKCLDVIRRMQNEGRTIVLVTHSMDQVTQFCDQAALLHHGQLRAQGSPADVISAFRKLTAEDANGAHVRVDAATPVKTEKKEEPQPQVLRVTCRTGSGSTLDSVHTGETLEINAEFSGAGSDAYVARIGVYSGSQLIFETSTDRLGLPPFEPGQPATCRFVLRELPLAGGRYRIAVSTAPDRYAAVLHTLPAAVQFSVSFSSDSAGPMAVEASAESVAGI
jgi:ABC-2 type transport system ATP-binding protein